jgi:hypothetical protein
LPVDLAAEALGDVEIGPLVVNPARYGVTAAFNKLRPMKLKVGWQGAVVVEPLTPAQPQPK